MNKIIQRNQNKTEKIIINFNSKISTKYNEVYLV